MAAILGASRGSGREGEAAVVASRPAGVATHGYPALPQHLSDLGGGLTGSVEHLLVGESDGCPAIDRGIEIALEVPVPCGC